MPTLKYLVQPSQAVSGDHGCLNYHGVCEKLWKHSLFGYVIGSGDSLTDYFLAWCYVSFWIHLIKFQIKQSSRQTNSLLLLTNTGIKLVCGLYFLLTAKIEPTQQQSFPPSNCFMLESCHVQSSAGLWESSTAIHLVWFTHTNPLIPRQVGKYSALMFPEL